MHGIRLSSALQAKVVSVAVFGGAHTLFHLQSLLLKLTADLCPCALTDPNTSQGSRGIPLNDQQCFSA